MPDPGTANSSDAASSPRPGTAIAEARDRAFALLALAVAAVIFFAGLSVHPLQEPDEGRYAEIAREMARSGDWLVPRLDGIRYFEKPPLFFWVAAAAIRLLGSAEWVVRLPSALAALSAAATTLLMARRAFGRRTAPLAALVFATMPIVSLLARFVLVDVLLCALVTGSVACLASLAEDPRRRAEALGFWALAGLAFLCKGPIGLALPLSGALPYAALARGGGFLRALARPLGPAVFLAIAAPWYVAMERANPGYLRAFFLEQNVGRLVSGASFGRDAPTWYYLPVLAGALLPWSFAVPAWLRRVPWAAAIPGPLAGPLRRFARGVESGAGDLEGKGRERLFFACMVLGPLALLSIAHSKLAYYVLPILPPLCVLTADAIVREGDVPGPARSRPPAWLLPFAAAALALSAATAWVSLHPERLREAVVGRLALEHEALLRDRLELLLPLAGPVALLLGLLGAGAALSVRESGRSPPERAILGLVLGLALLEAPAPWLWARLGTAFSVKDAAIEARRGLEPGEPVVAFRRFFRGLPFYLDRTVVLWAAKYQEFGQRPPPSELAGRCLDGEERALAELWSGSRRVVAVCDDDDDVSELERIVGKERVHVVCFRGRTAVVSSRPLPPPTVGPLRERRP